MEHFLNELLGLHRTSHDLGAGQMCVRAVVVFLWSLFVLRLAGRRAFASTSAHDTVLKIILGAVLSRAIVAASPFGATLLAGLVFAALRRLLALAAERSAGVARLLKGTPDILAQDGHLNPAAMRRRHISEEDVREALRVNLHLDDLAQARVIRLERTGEISVVREPPSGAAT